MIDELKNVAKALEVIGTIDNSGSEWFAIVVDGVDFEDKFETAKKIVEEIEPNLLVYYSDYEDYSDDNREDIREEFLEQKVIIVETTRNRYYRKLYC